MQIEPFGVEMWMTEWETRCELNLAETCVQSLTIAELLELAGQTPVDLAALLPMKMTYGDIEGSPRLRSAITGLYDHQAPENVVVTHGTIGANMLVHKTLVSAGDRVVAVVPTYQQHYSIPESIGADVVHLTLRAEDGYLPDLEELDRLTSSDTQLIALNNPNNPTGALIDQSMLRGIVDIARATDTWILCDEVYRGTDAEGSGTTASIADLYEKGISTASMSKAYSLAGLRLGWIVGATELIDAVTVHRDYDTISVGMIDDHFATLALEHGDAILARSRALAGTNREIVDAWVTDEPLISWVRPRSGTTGLLRYDLPMSSRDFCLSLLEHTGVMLTPGSALGVEGHLRIGYANATEVLSEGLDRISGFLATAAAA